MGLSALDASLFRFINSGLHAPAIDPTVKFITGYYHLLMLPLAALMLLRGGKAVVPAFLTALAAFALSDWAAYTLKGVIGRPRPCNVLEGVNLLVGCSGSPSMPSNHASGSSAIAATFFLMTKDRLRCAMIAIAIAVAFSRPYVGVHYPSDVLVGAFLGAAISYASVRYYGWTAERAKENPLRAYLTLALTAGGLLLIYCLARMFRA